MSEEDNFSLDFQEDYNSVADKVEPHQRNKKLWIGLSVALFLVLMSSAVAVHFNYPQHAFWQPDKCQYQFELDSSIEEDGEYRFKIAKKGSTAVNTTLSTVGSITSRDNMSVSDQVFVYLPSQTESATVYGQCDRSATYQFS